MYRSWPAELANTQGETQMPYIMTIEEAEYKFLFDAYQPVCAAYRAGLVDAATFLSARRAMDSAGAAWDAARNA